MLFIDRPPLLVQTTSGIFCPKANIYIDPVRKVDHALITHGHSDHAYPGMRHYLTHNDSVPILKHRLGAGISINGIDHGSTIEINGVRFSFHPAGHVIGSSQIRVEHDGEVWVASGDYKRCADPFAGTFEVVRCHTLITESTFGLPIYQWYSNEYLSDTISQWWRRNAEMGITSIFYCYSLGKAQRLLGMLDLSIGAVIAHHSIQELNKVIRDAGIALPETLALSNDYDISTLKRSLILAPGAGDGQWLNKIPDKSIAAASGWMASRKRRLWSGTDTSFVISDHTDWPGILQTVEETSAERVLVNHGYAEAVSMYLRERGVNASVLQ